MEQTFDGIFNYPGFCNMPSRCGVEVYRAQNRAVVVIKELPDNEGDNITRCSERIATAIWREMLGRMPPEQITWLEYYPRIKGSPASYDLITYQYNSKQSCFESPLWKRLTLGQYRKAIRGVDFC